MRHAAVLGLSRVVRVCKRVPLREGFSHVAWRGLTELHTAEQDPRVTEAFKLALVTTTLHTTCVIISSHFSGPANVFSWSYIRSVA